MIAIPQSVTRRIPLKAYLSSDHVSAATGKTIAVVLSKNGGAFGNPSAGATNATEIGSGWYYVDLSTTDTGTQGPIIIRATATGVDDVEAYRQVADAHNAGFDGVPSAVAAATGGLPTVDASNAVKVQSGTGANQISLSSGTVTLAAVTHTGAVIPTVTTVTTTTTATNLTNAPTAGDLTATMKTSVENAVWDAARSSHIGTGVFGQLGLGILRDNTATAGAAGSITLDASASTTVDFYKGAIIALYSGTGAGQAPRSITAYSTGRVASVSPNWAVIPDATSKFLITAFDDPPFVGTDGRVLVSADSHTSGETAAAVTGAVGSVTGNVGGNVVGSTASVTGAVASVTGSVGSVTGAVGSVTGNVGGNVVGSVASVTGRVTANADQWAGTTIPAPTVNGVPKVDIVDIAGAAVSTSTAQLGVNAVQIGASVPGSATIGTVTNLTANNDKTGYALSSGGVQAIWDALTSALTTVGSIGKLLATNVDATTSSRSSHTAADVWAVTTRTLSSFGTLVSDGATAVWGAASRTLTAFAFSVTASTVTDKTGYSLTTAYDSAKTAAQAGDAMTLTGAYDAAKTALPTSAYTAPDNTSITAIKAKTDNLPASPAATADIPTASANASATWDALRASHTTSGTFGQGAASVQGNVTGSVASVAAAVTVGTNNDKTGYALANPGPNPTGTVVADGSNSPTSFVTDRTEAVDGYWDDALLLLTSGVLAGQVKKVSGYAGATKTVTVGAFTSTPVAGVTFQLINR